MADYTFHSLVEPIKNNNTIQTILDVDALAAPAKAALTGYITSLGLPAAETQHLLWSNIGVAVVIENLAITYYLPSLGLQTPAPDLKRTSSLKDKVIEMQALESKFPKCQMLMFARTAADNNWIWLNTEVIQNSGNRVNTLKLIPYLNQGDVFVPGRGTQIGIQFIADPASNATLPQSQDRLTVQGSVRLDVNPMGGADLKKNDETEQLRIRLTALETLLQPFGAATTTADGTTGMVKGAAMGQQNYLLRGDQQWQNPAAFANQSDIDTAISNLIGGAPGALDTLNELAQALGDNANFASSITNLLAEKVAKTGNETIAGSKTFSGFTKLGELSVGVKFKLLTSTTAVDQGGIRTIAHNLTEEKIIGVQVLVRHFANSAVSLRFSTSVGYDYDWAYDANFIYINNSTSNSAAILAKPVTVLITYIEN